MSSLPLNPTTPMKELLKVLSVDNTERRDEEKAICGQAISRPAGAARGPRGVSRRGHAGASGTCTLTQWRDHRVPVITELTPLLGKLGNNQTGVATW